MLYLEGICFHAKAISIISVSANLSGRKPEVSFPDSHTGYLPEDTYFLHN